MKVTSWHHITDLFNIFCPVRPGWSTQVVYSHSMSREVGGSNGLYNYCYGSRNVDVYYLSRYDCYPLTSFSPLSNVVKYRYPRRLLLVILQVILGIHSGDQNLSLLPLPPGFVLTQNHFNVQNILDRQLGKVHLRVSIVGSFRFRPVPG